MKATINRESFAKHYAAAAARVGAAAGDDRPNPAGVQRVVIESR